MKLGGANVAALKVGAANASKAYLGSTLVWEAGGDAPTPTAGGPAIHSASGWSSASLTQNLGWRFTVGANDITVTHLRLYSFGSATETVTLYRQSDGAVLATAEVTAEGGWGETEITPLVLSSGQDYVVSRYAAGASRAVARGSSAYVLDPGVTLVGSRSSESSAMPSSTTTTSYLSAAFRTAAPESGYRFYRLNIADNNGRSTVNIAEVQVRSSVGGDDETVAGAGFASSVSGTSTAFDGNKAFDDDAATFWSTANLVTAATLATDLGTGREITAAQYTIRARADANNGSPKDWTFEGSNDLETWDVLDTVTGETGWANGETRTYTV